MTRFSHVVLTFMCIFYKHVFPELEQLRLVMRYIEQRCDRSGHAHWEGHFRFTEIEDDTVIEMSDVSLFKPITKRTNAKPMQTRITVHT